MYIAYANLITKMETIECIPRKWGNSLGITIPKEVAEREALSEGKPVMITLKTKPDLRSLFGTVKFSQSSQEAKDEMRKGWHD